MMMEKEPDLMVHPNTFEYYKPTEQQIEKMEMLRKAAKDYAYLLEENLNTGPDKTFVLRSLRTLAMWVNVCVTRDTDGQPRD
jgi:hypothetical protein